MKIEYNKGQLKVLIDTSIILNMDLQKYTTTHL